MPTEPEDLEARLARMVKELNSLKAGLRLLGVKQCNTCGKWFLSQDGKALFEAGDPVCYNCIQKWWQQRAPELNIDERQVIEHKLLRWLVAHYSAQVIHQARKLPRPEALELKIMVACDQCNGLGKTGSHSECHHCEGRGTVRVVKFWPDLP